MMRRDYGIYAGSRNARLREEMKSARTNPKGKMRTSEDYVDVSSRTIHTSKWLKRAAVFIITILVIFIMIGAISILATR